jgi:hypothetical protein
MNAATVTFIIYFVGITAITDRPGGGKIAIFPTARLGTYEGVVLWPHRTYLHLRGADFVDQDPPAYCNEIGGDWNTTTGICSLELRGATLWTQTAQPFSQDDTFKKIPAFGKLCPDAPNPKRVYTEGTDPDFVAARFEMAGGAVSGCNRKYGAFVTKLAVETTYGVLVIERGHGTLRIRLANNAQLSIENRADVIPGRTHAHTTATNANNCNEYGREHFAWYHFMASGDIRCPVTCPTLVENSPCGDIPGVTEPGTGLPSASGPDCGNTNYP